MLISSCRQGQHKEIKCHVFQNRPLKKRWRGVDWMCGHVWSGGQRTQPFMYLTDWAATVKRDYFKLPTLKSSLNECLYLYFSCGLRGAKPIVHTDGLSPLFSMSCLIKQIMVSFFFPSKGPHVLAEHPEDLRLQQQFKARIALACSHSSCAWLATKQLLKLSKLPLSYLLGLKSVVIAAC